MMVAGGLVLVGCGGDGGPLEGGTTEPETSESDPSEGEGDEVDAEVYVQASVDSWLEDADEATMDEATVRCMATAVVDLVGADALAAADISPHEFGDAESFHELDVELPANGTTVLTDRLVECGMGEPMSAALVDRFSTEAGEELPPEAIACLEDVVDDQLAAEGVATDFVDGEREGAVMMVGEVMAACPGVPTALIVAEAAAPVTPEEEACVRGVIEAHSDLASSASVDLDAAAREELWDLIVDNCPSAVDG